MVSKTLRRLMSRRLLWVSAGALVVVAGAGGGAVWATTTSATPPGPADGPVGILSAVEFEHQPTSPLGYEESLGPTYDLATASRSRPS
jgi:hypothetical protein